MMQALDELIGLVSSRFEVFRNFITLFKLETRLAGLSVVPFLLNLGLLIAVALTLWLITMGLAGYVINMLTGSMLLAIGSVLVLNLIVFLILIKYALFNLKKMSFEKTRKFLVKKKDTQSHELKKKAD